MLEILRKLDESDLLNEVGRILAEQPKLFPETLENMKDYFEGMDEEMVSEKLATSSLTGADNELAIEQWIDEEEQGTMYRIIEGE